MQVYSPDEHFMKGVLRDLGTLGIILIFVLIFAFTLGTALVLLYLFGEAFALIGSLISLFIIPVIIFVGIILNKWFWPTTEIEDKGFNKLFKRRPVEPCHFTTKYRLRFIGQRMTTLGIIILIFTISIIIGGFLLLIPGVCLIFLPVAFPFLVIAITVPAVGWIAITYAFDPYDPEPRSMLVIGLMWGMLSTFPSLFLNTYNSTWMEEMGISTAVFSAPIVEEFFKSLGFVLIFSKLRDETDGIIYGATFGAGFSLLENFLYGAVVLLEAGGVGFILLIAFRSFFNILIHMIGPAAIGMLIGASIAFSRRMREKEGEKAPSPLLIMIFTLFGIIILLIISMANHMAWNFLAGFYPIGFILDIMLGIMEFFLFIGMVLIAFFLGTSRFNKRIREFECSSRDYRFQKYHS